MNFLRYLNRLQRTLLQSLLLLSFIGVLVGPEFPSKTTYASLSVPVKLSFSPDNLSLSQSKTISVMIDAKTFEIGFIRVELLFNNTLINLSEEINTSSLFNTVITKTSKVNANATGRIIIVIALSPGDLPPTGVNEIARITIEPKTSNFNQHTSLSFFDEGIQIVDKNTTTQSFTSELLPIIINPYQFTKFIYLPLIKR